MLSPSAQLLYAAWCGNTPKVRELLAQGVPTEVKDGKGRTPLMLAAAARAAETVSLLLETGADPSARNKGNRQLIDYVSDSAVAQQILAAIPAEQRGAAATRLLFNACGNPDLVKCALEAGANVNARNKRGDTPLICHSWFFLIPEKSHACIRMLLAAGANPCVSNCHRKSPMLPAVQQDDTEAIELRCRSALPPDIADDVYHAIHAPCSCRLQQLIEDRPDLIHRVDTGTGYTPLLEAAWSGNTEALRILLNAGAAACIDYRDADEGVSALHAAVIACRDSATAKPENVNALLSAGADVNLTDRDGWTPLHSCAHYHLPQIVPLLLKAGANTQLRDNYGATPEDIAASHGHTDIINLLRERQNMGSKSKKNHE